MKHRGRRRHVTDGTHAPGPWRRIAASLVGLAILGAGSPTLRGAEAAAQTGTIVGQVTLPAPRRPRRTADPYRRATSQIQDVPAVVYLRGPVGGAEPRGPGPSVSMVQRDTTFQPAAVFVRVGGSVEFPNDDPFFHNVFSASSAQRFDLGRYPQGESKVVTFDEPGVVDVFCEVHDFMRAVIIVTENPFHAEVGEDRSFRLAGVPPGEHTLVVWHPDFRPVERRVTVTSGGTARVEVELTR